jgi:hypothetical protein
MLSAYDRNGACLAESHAAAVKHKVITSEKAMGMIKRYLQLTTVMAAKHRANAHAVPRIIAKVAAGRPPSCHANIAANR